jgi:tRNA (guanine37-N1)-methyltransferase
MTIDIVTIFPDFFTPFTETSMIRKAQMYGYVSINVHNLRDHSAEKHRKVDDTPYGGGAGMVMTYQPFRDAIKSLRTKGSKVILMSPQGKVFNQETANRLALENHLVLLCGHYEGVDARVLDLVDEELSVGDYVLTGGEIPAMTVADAVIRLVPGVLHEASARDDSLQNGLLKHPQYTKPETIDGKTVPSVLLSGNHGEIARWRLEQSVIQTLEKRPDLIEKGVFDPETDALVKTVKKRKDASETHKNP